VVLRESGGLLRLVSVVESVLQLHFGILKIVDLTKGYNTLFCVNSC
jgi:hypothetical protein